MTSAPQVHPALTRLRRRLELCQAPLVRLWSWPRSGRRLLLRNLTRFHPDSWFQLPTDDGLPAAVRGATSATHLWWPQEITDSGRQAVRDGAGGSKDVLDTTLDALGPGQRLYVLGRPRLRSVPRPQVWVRPAEWLLTAGELAALVENPFAEASVDTWMELTAGWWGPFTWLLQRSTEGREPVEEDLEGLGRWLRDEVLDDLSPLQAELLDACRLTGCRDPALWRRVCLPYPELLQALEEAVHLDGWLGGPWPHLWDRVPWRTAREHGALGPTTTEARRTHLHRQLGAAASALGDSAVAIHHLTLAGETVWLERWQGWRGEGAEARHDVSGGRSGAKSAPTARPSPPGESSVPFGATSAGSGRIIDIDLLGPPRVVDSSGTGGPRPVRWTLRRALMTLAYLLLAPQHRVSRDELIDAVWDGVDERGIAKNFHPTLSTLRRVLGKAPAEKGRRGASLILFRQGVYRLSEEAEWRLDVDRFSDLVRRGQELQRAGKVSWGAAVESWQQAWRLYRGPLLGDAEDAWVVSRRRQLHETYRRLLRQLADLCAELRRDEEALDVYRALLLEEPFEEAVHLAVMELYGRKGRRDLVRRQFVRLQEMLRSELGVEPQAATQQRFHQLMH